MAATDGSILNGDGSIPLNDQEKTQVLFKNFLNLPFNKPDKFFTEEIALASSSYTFGDGIFLDQPPLEPSWVSLSHSHPYTNASGKQIIECDSYERDTTNTVEKFTRLKLEKVSSTTNYSYTTYYEDPKSGVLPLLRNSFQFPYNKTINNDYPYNYILYIGTSTVDRGNYIFDFKTGYITLYGITVPAGATLYLTFVRYCGRVGIDTMKKDYFIKHTDLTSSHTKLNFDISYHSIIAPTIPLNVAINTKLTYIDSANNNYTYQSTASSIHTATSTTTFTDIENTIKQEGFTSRIATWTMTDDKFSLEVQVIGSKTYDIYVSFEILPSISLLYEQVLRSTS